MAMPLRLVQVPKLPPALVLHGGFCTPRDASQLTAYIEVTKKASPVRETPSRLTEIIHRKVKSELD